MKSTRRNWGPRWARLTGHHRSSEVSAADAAFMDDLHESLLTQRTPGTRIVLYTILVLLVIGLVWASLARVEEITRGEGKVIPRSQEQIIQSLEGGILDELNVAEGDVVKRGQPLLRIDRTRAKASYDESFAKYIALKSTVERLRAEAYGMPLKFSDEVMAVPSEVELETRAYHERRKALEEGAAALRTSYALAMREINLAQPLADKGLMSQVEILRMRRQANDLRTQEVERRNRFQADANAELVRAELELGQVRENLIGRRDVLARTTINAPMDGTIKDIRVHTVGGVIQPGEHIMELVPLEDSLRVEAKIKPQDVAFLRPGLPATVKISAYDYGIYGGLKGKVELISADALKDEQRTAARPDETYYRVTVLTDSNALRAGGKQLPIIPGMTGVVEIRTGEKTVLEYLLKPLFKAREAFRER
ncbi:HlyD family type I secretion periplasmic adaptor subunit [Lysobacter arvi]|uniref:Membrane fusion protein (MFP) family protein n=1 Tax=Lysobacter arvi TaxID=3038776 RepID=A0ABU1CCG6_9GAMM|nr:HlyD family type I secretion periplasmic adaptor subunit [Lysobacter arvi]MDR0181747.1 HlyD family type I secretion periplasmic adaptor subunit [Lysobacter arvi]